MEVVFDVRNKKDYEIFRRFADFGESLLEIKRIKEANPINFIFFYKKDKKWILIII